METLLILFMVALLAAVVIALFRPPRTGGDSLQNLTQAIQQGQAQTAALSEKVVKLEVQGRDPLAGGP